MRDIPGYEGLYAATEDGRIWSYRAKKFLKPVDNGKGYLCANLYKNGKGRRCYLHRLIAETYVPNPAGLPQVSHIDETRTNNCVSNLTWASQKDNSNMPLHKQRLSEKAKKNPVICLETQEIFDSITEAAKVKNTYAGSIRYCCLGQRKTAGGLHWAYYEDEE